MGIHVVFSDAKWAHISELLKKEGHDFLTATKSNTMTFISHLETQFPTVYADIKKGITDLTDSHLSGGDKAVKVATDVMTSIPDVLAVLPGIKAALVGAVTVLYSDEVSAFKNVVQDTLINLGSSPSSPSAPAAPTA